MSQTEEYSSDSERVLAALKDQVGEWVPDLYRKCHCMVHSRIADLRKQGYTIECKCFGKGDYRYRLTEELAAVT